MEKEENQINGKIKLGYKRHNLLIDCLALADYSIILSVLIETAIKQVELLKERAEKNRSTNIVRENQIRDKYQKRFQPPRWCPWDFFFFIF